MDQMKFMEEAWALLAALPQVKADALAAGDVIIALENAGDKQYAGGMYRVKRISPSRKKIIVAHVYEGVETEETVLVQRVLAFERKGKYPRAWDHSYWRELKFKRASSAVLLMAKGYAAWCARQSSGKRSSKREAVPEGWVAYRVMFTDGKEQVCRRQARDGAFKFAVCSWRTERGGHWGVAELCVTEDQAKRQKNGMVYSGLTEQAVEVRPIGGRQTIGGLEGQLGEVWDAC